eukprot:3098258-Pyramimonas_sp.AAC.1
MHPGRTREVTSRFHQAETCSLYVRARLRETGSTFALCAHTTQHPCRHEGLLHSETQRGGQNPTTRHEIGQAWAVAYPDELWEEPGGRNSRQSQ